VEKGKKFCIPRGGGKKFVSYNELYQIWGGRADAKRREGQETGFRLTNIAGKEGKRRLLRPGGKGAPAGADMGEGKMGTSSFKKLIHINNKRGILNRKKERYSSFD